MVDQEMWVAVLNSNSSNNVRVVEGRGRGQRSIYRAGTRMLIDSDIPGSPDLPTCIASYVLASTSPRGPILVLSALPIYTIDAGLAFERDVLNLSINEFGLPPCLAKA